jgi:DNA-binding CsgD family transcriptional regulator
LELHAYVKSAQGQCDDETRLLLGAVRASRSPQGDVAREAFALWALSDIARDIPNTLNLSELWESQRTLASPAQLARVRFLTRRNLAWSLCHEAGAGLHVASFLRDLRQAARTALKPAHRVLSALDAAELAFSLDEPHSGFAWLLDADALADTVDWSRERGAEYEALLNAAILFAPHNAARARHYLRLYRSLPHLKFVSKVRAGKRYAAMEAYAVGLVETHHGRRADAVLSLECAYDIFSGIRHNLRAALAASELFNITQDRKYRDRAADLVRTYPNSSLARRLGVLGTNADARYAALTAAERHVFELLTAHLSRHDIARKLNRSISTINNIMANIFSKWDVHSQRELVLEVRKSKPFRSKTGDFYSAISPKVEDSA